MAPAPPPREINLQQAVRLAAEALSAGDFGAAHALYSKLHARLPDDPVTHHALAGLTTLGGNTQAGRAILREFFARHPVSPPPTNLPARPLLLKVRGCHRTVPLIGQRSDGSYLPKLRGGHFTTTYLLRPEAVAQRTWTVVPGQPVDATALPACDLMLNTISEPDLETPSLDALQDHLERHPDTPVLNRPERVRATTRDGNFQRLREMPGVIFPKTVRLDCDGFTTGDLAAALEKHGFDRPVILRATGTQTARTTQLVRTADDLAAYVGDGLSGEHYAIAYREILWRGEFFRKLRLFCIDGQYYPVVCHLDRVWNVHGGNRKEIMRTRDDLMDEEKRFLSDWRAYVGTPAVDALERLAEATALEFFGIDFTLDEEGRIFIYELNASMRHSFDHARTFPYKQPHDQAISDAFEAMILGRLPRG